MAANPKTVEQQISVSQMPRIALDRTGNVVDAAKLLEEWAAEDPALKSYLTEPYLPPACYEAVRRCCREDRRKVWMAPNYAKDGAGKRVLKHANSLLDFWLPGGPRLRDATKADLLAAVTFYSEQAIDMSHKARWLAAIATRVGRKKVSTAFNESSLRKLQDQTSHD